MDAELSQRQHEVIERWLHYLGSELAVGSPSFTEPPLVEVRREGTNGLMIQTSHGWARIALISCGDERVNNSEPIYPALWNVTKIGDGRWK
jgi:hypothetical protein